MTEDGKAETSNRRYAFYSRRFCRDEALATKLITSDTRDGIARSSFARIANCRGDSAFRALLFFLRSSFIDYLRFALIANYQRTQ
jgi:hypothetical protein